ncbi:MAG: CD1247 N-terminal domain-containing protein [Faecalibacterium sp.]
MELNKKAAYLQGLVDGLGIDDTTKEGKIIKAMSALLGEMAEVIESVDEDLSRAYDQINDLSDELEDLEADLYEERTKTAKARTLRMRTPTTTTMPRMMTSPASRSMKWPAPTAARPFTSARMIWMQAKPTARTAA